VHGSRLLRRCRFYCRDIPGDGLRLRLSKARLSQVLLVPHQIEPAADTKTRNAAERNMIAERRWLRCRAFKSPGSYVCTGRAKVHVSNRDGLAARYRGAVGEVGGGTLPALPIPLGSLTELLVPPALPGPAGTPLTPVVPAPAEPAFGVPPAPAVVPPAEDAPPVEPPPEDPPAPCAKADIGSIRLAMTATAIVDFFDI
jgi:hypothetical protein